MKGLQNPKVIYAGDIVIFSHSHIGIAVENSNGGTVKSIEGNTAGGGPSSREVAIVTRNLSSISDAITIKSTGRQPIGSGPAPPLLEQSESTSPQGIVSQLLDRAESSGRGGVDPYADNTPYANGAKVELPVKYYGPVSDPIPAPENSVFPE